MYLDPHKVQYAISLEQIKQGISFDSILNCKVFSWENITEEKHESDFFRFNKYSVEDLKKSYFCNEIRSFSITELDPCMSIGFFINDDQDIADLKDFILSVCLHFSSYH